MNIGNIGKIAKAAYDGVSDFCTQHGHIAFGIGAVVGLAGCIALAYNARPKVDRIMAEKKKRTSEIERSDLPEEEKEEQRKELKKDTAVAMVKTLGPLVGLAGATVGCTCASVASATNKIDSLVGIVNQGNAAYEQLSDTAKEMLGEEKSKELDEKVAKKKMSDEDGNIRFSQEGFVKTGLGDYPFYDMCTGATFLCSIPSIEHAVNECNTELNSRKIKKITYNYFRHKLNLPDILFGDNRVWTKPMILNCGNSVPWGEEGLSIRVLDWIERPMIIG